MVLVGIFCIYSNVLKYNLKKPSKMYRKINLKGNFDKLKM